MAHCRGCFCFAGDNRFILARIAGHLVYRNWTTVFIKGVRPSTLQKNGFQTEVPQTRIEAHFFGEES